MEDDHRTDAELDGEPRARCIISAGPAYAEGQQPAEDASAVVMTGFNYAMLKVVNKTMGWPVTTALSMQCTLDPYPAMIVFNAQSYGAFVHFLLGRGVSALAREGIVQVKVTPLSNMKKVPVTLKNQRERKQRPQVTNHKALVKALHPVTAEVGAGADDEEEEAPEDAVVEATSSRARIGSWNEQCNEIVALAENGKVLMSCLQRRQALKKALTGTQLEQQAWKLLTNPAVGLCPFKFKDDDEENECNWKRHALGASNNLYKLIDKKEARAPHAHLPRA